MIPGRSSNALRIGVVGTVILIGIALRIAFAHDHPLTGDEVVSALAASGTRADYLERIPSGRAPLSDFVQPLTAPTDITAKDALQANAGKHGGHPPLYYFSLRLWITAFGPSLCAFRSLSILLSVLAWFFAVWSIRNLAGSHAALIALPLLGLAPYALYYAPMVRPYPMAMMWAFAATGCIAAFSATDQKKRTRYLAGFALCSTCGIYTIYHYVFVLILHLVWLLALDIKNPRRWGLSIAVGLIISALYTPWLFALASHIDHFDQTPTPFQGDNASLFAVFKSVWYDNVLHLLNRPAVTHHLPALLVRALRFGLLLLAVAGSLWGLCRLPKKTRFAVALGLVAYIIANLGADRLVGTRTFSMPKLLFFLAPFAVGLWAIALQPLAKKRCALLLGPALGWFLLGDVWILKHAPRYEDPYELNAFQNEIRRHTEPHQTGLYLFSYPKSRWIFSGSHLAMHLHPEAQGLLVPRAEIPRLTTQLGDTRDLDFIALMNMSQRNYGHLKYDAEDIKAVDAVLQEQGFTKQLATRPSRNELILYVRSEPVATP